MPVVLSGKKLEASELAILQLMALINSDADNHAIELSIKQDVSLGLNLLRLVNTPAAGGHQRIASIKQALLLMGRRQLQRWLQILLYTKSGKGTHMPSPLLLLATTRGRMLELIAQKTRPGNRNIADTAFTVGIMSLMDALFSLPLNDILEKDCGGRRGQRGLVAPDRRLRRDAAAGRRHRATRRRRRAAATDSGEIAVVGGGFVCVATGCI
ncbi:EAL and HDOD domain-containing protein [Undibacterium arcticum]